MSVKTRAGSPGHPGADQQISLEEDRREVLDLIHALAAQHGFPVSTAYKWRARALLALRAAHEQRRREEEERTGGRGTMHARDHAP